MNKAWRILGCVAAGALIFLLLGWVTMTLWNWLVPVLFNGPIINFWQAMGLLLLSKILFHGFGGKGGHWKRNHCNPEGDHSHWKGRFDKFSSMNPEEREAFKRKMKEKWCTRDQSNAESKSDNANV